MEGGGVVKIFRFITLLIATHEKKNPPPQTPGGTRCQTCFCRALIKLSSSPPTPSLNLGKREGAGIETRFASPPFPIPLASTIPVPISKPSPQKTPTRTCVKPSLPQITDLSQRPKGTEWNNHLLAHIHRWLDKSDGLKFNSRTWGLFLADDSCLVLSWNDVY